MPGMHRSLRQGRGNEFFQYRAYEQGEDLKVVDWKVYAKRSELVAKTYQEDTNFSVFIVIDSSASMGYTGENTPYSKLRYAPPCLEPAWLTWLTAKGIKSDFLVTERKPSNGFDRLRVVDIYSESLPRSPSLKAKEPANMRKPGTNLQMSCLHEPWSSFYPIFWNQRIHLAIACGFPHLHIMNPCVCRYLTRRNWILPEKEALLSLKWKENAKSPLLQMQSAKDTRKRWRDLSIYINDKISSVSAEFETFLSNQDLGHALRRFLGIRNRMK